MNPNQMNVCWLFLEEKEIWAKCKECGEWNKIREKSDIDIFRPSKEKPAKEICQNAECRKELIIERLWFARKGMNKPEEQNQIHRLQRKGLL